MVGMTFTWPDGVQEGGGGRVRGSIGKRHKGAFSFHPILGSSADLLQE